jgi:hypothetical protein
VAIDCALDNRPSTGGWAVGCSNNAPGTGWFLYQGVRSKAAEAGQDKNIGARV